ncbi:DUF4372 domain-containing protein [Symmachiella dynata]|uniref:DUF4372 domain-containing protein n=1 Tax=Symmachiella dynata TaxID=2527995 RepID=UPI003C6FAE3B
MVQRTVFKDSHSEKGRSCSTAATPSRPSTVITKPETWPKCDHRLGRHRFGEVQQPGIVAAVRRSHCRLYGRRTVDEIAAGPRSNTNATDIVSCRDQFLCMAFSQLIFCDSLRDIETDLRAMPSKLYHAGFRSRMEQGTLADATRRRDWRIGRDLAESLISRVLISAYGRFLLLSPRGAK